MRPDVDRAARKVGDNRVVETGARVGYAVNGLMHLLIAWLALQLVISGTAGSADQSGAMAMLASHPIGMVTLWVAVVGFGLLGLWQLPEAIREPELGDKAKCLAKAVLYAALAFSAWGFIQGAGSSSEEQTRNFTSTLMDVPFGRALIVVAGVVLLAVGGYHVYKGWAKKFLDDLEKHPGRWAVHAGRIGYICKGIALATVGVFFGFAGLNNNPEQATGLDGTLHQVLALPFGQVGAGLVALGFIAFAFYCFARARYADV